MTAVFIVALLLIAVLACMYSFDCMDTQLRRDMYPGTGVLYLLVSVLCISVSVVVYYKPWI